VPEQPLLTGILLSGGSGSRLGRPKADIVLAGQRLLDRALAKLAGLCTEVLIAGRAPAHGRGAGRWVADSLAAQGPMAGLLAGLEAMLTPVGLVLACDLPLVPPALLSYLAQRLRGHWAAVPVAMGKLHPLCAAYSRDLLPALRAWAAQGDYAVHRLLEALGDRVARVEEAELRFLGDPAVMLLNVNTPADLAAAARHLEGG
jgi:molybdopterin-guanine dinucleotide biosynthesis protein A